MQPERQAGKQGQDRPHQHDEQEAVTHLHFAVFAVEPEKQQQPCHQRGDKGFVERRLGPVADKPRDTHRHGKAQRKTDQQRTEHAEQRKKTVHGAGGGGRLEELEADLESEEMHVHGPGCGHDHHDEVKPKKAAANPNTEAKVISLKNPSAPITAKQKNLIIRLAKEQGKYFENLSSYNMEQASQAIEELMAC